MPVDELDLDQLCAANPTLQAAAHGAPDRRRRLRIGEEGTMKSTIIGLLLCLALAAGGALAEEKWAGRSDASLLEEARSLVANKRLFCTRFVGSVAKSSALVGIPPT